jgi:two-component system, cell cycle sensor histidine kinase PleC
MRSRFNTQKKSSLLSRYSADLGRLISRQRAETALRAAAIESALANRAKSEFLANMSHELRTPLNAVIGFSDLIGKKDGRPLTQEQTHEYAGHISRAGNHLLNIISDILDISKIESGSFTLDTSIHDMRDIVDSSVALIQPRVEAKKQHLDVKIDDNIPPLNIDGRRIKQVLINLLSNAHKFTPEGGRIVVVATADGHRVVTVAVTDTGIGMAPEQLEHVLKPFVQVQSSYSRNHEGTGLGLPISKALVEQHGGRFFLSSRPDGGTMAAFTLPVAATGGLESGHPAQPKSFLFRSTP